MPSVKELTTKLPALLLWVASFILGLADIYYLQNIFVVIFSQYSRDSSLASTLGYCLLGVSALVFLAVIVGTGEYHMKHAGEPSSWRLFAITLIAMIAIPVIAYFMNALG